MEIIDDVLSFDFQGGLESTNATFLNFMNSYNGVVGGGTRLVDAKNIQRRKNYLQIVCCHWLCGLCMKGDSCGFLH